jgi:hypothetical protein
MTGYAGLRQDMYLARPAWENLFLYGTKTTKLNNRLLGVTHGKKRIAVYDIV